MTIEATKNFLYYSRSHILTSNYTSYTDRIVDCISFAIPPAVFWFGIGVGTALIGGGRGGVGPPKSYYSSIFTVHGDR